MIIVGSGFAGLCMAIKLKQAGMHDFVILERGDDVGGTWRDNHYPGAECDIPSHLYSFSFEPNPRWSKSYPVQSELLAYQQHCARKYGLMPHLRLSANVASARYDEASHSWTVRTEDGRLFVASVLICGMGGLSNPAYPKVEGLECFAGEQFHSATWRHDVDLRGKRVAVIGSGASAIQFVPQIVDQVAHLDYYQRTPPWVMPKPDHPTSAFKQRLFAWLPWTQKLHRWAIYWSLEWRVLGFTRYPQIMEAARKMGKHHIARHIKDPVLRKKLTPAYRPGCKRILLSNNYYPALAKPQVDVVTEGIAKVTPHAIVTQDGTQRPADVIIFGTGFKVQEFVPRGTVFGAGGKDLFDQWADNGEAYRGTAVPGFPNLFFIVGPNTGLGHNSMIFMIESQVRYIMQALKTMKRRKLAALEVRQQALRSYNDRLQQMLKGTVWSTGGCQSWYLDANGRNTTLWPTYTYQFRSMLKSFDVDNYLATPRGACASGAAPAQMVKA